jgi:hypothetical protein
MHLHFYIAKWQLIIDPQDAKQVWATGESARKHRQLFTPPERVVKVCASNIVLWVFLRAYPLMIYLGPYQRAHDCVLRVSAPNLIRTVLPANTNRYLFIAYREIVSRTGVYQN